MKYTKEQLLGFWDECQKITEHDSQFDNGVDEFSLIKKTGDKYTLVIGGSSKDIKEWTSNFVAYPTIGGVHRGFHIAAIAIRNYLIDHSGIQISDIDLIIGHSRGGSIGQALAIILDNIPVVSFGAPKVFLRRLHGKLEFDHYAVVNKYDGVTRLPWGWKLYATNKYLLTKRIKGLEHTHYDDLIKECMYE